MEQPSHLSEEKQQREKKKWQIALRRYVIEKQPSTYYAPYFGLNINKFKKWIAIQFNEEQNWESFGKNWQFENVLSTRYFNLFDEADNKLCWNFVNIRVERTAGGEGIISPWHYFSNLFNNTKLQQCKKMLEKIERIVLEDNTLSPRINFLEEERTTIEHLASFSTEDFLRLNKGETIENLVLEKEIVKKFGV